MSLLPFTSEEFIQKMRHAAKVFQTSTLMVPLLKPLKPGTDPKDALNFLCTALSMVGLWMDPETHIMVDLTRRKDGWYSFRFYDSGRYEWVEIHWEDEEYQDVFARFFEANPTMRPLAYKLGSLVKVSDVTYVLTANGWLSTETGDIIDRDNMVRMDWQEVTA